MSSPTIAFAGTPATAATILTALSDYTNIQAILTAPDKKQGRGRTLSPPPVKATAQALGLPVHQPLSLKNISPGDILPPIDLLIVVAYGFLLPPAWLTYPKYGCLNVHYSLLPAWRGASPIQQSLLAQEATTGVSFMKMDEGLDTGPIYTQVPVTISSTETTLTLTDKLTQQAVAELKAQLPAICSGNKQPVPQEGQASYAPKIAKQDANINWTQSAAAIEAQMRAFTPWPICFSFLNDKRLRFLQAKALRVNEPQAIPGTIIRHNLDSIDIQTGHGQLRLTQGQLDGGKPLAMAEILRSKADHFAIGTTFTHA